MRKNWRYGVPVVCIAAGFLLASAHASSQGGELRELHTSRLSDLVSDVESTVRDVEQQRDALTAQLREAQSEAASDQGVAQALDRLEPLAGPGALTEVAGPGLVVTLTDAPRDQYGNYPPGASPDDLVVHQQDLQSVLNALWAGGATAIAVQDERITTWSAPRCIGNTLLLHGRAYSPPYVITAIGDAEELEDSLDSEPGVRLFRQYAARYGLGYEVEAEDELQVAAYEGRPSLRYARPVH
ncbi:DUF881 domain-containing protein [Hoyosella subflava]|uniref:Membrane spanning protein DUF881 n=1 Tax=Hoyosella subflava (strain DSM 45089 / JCM 17490 / NBRC 109087 / DQS3-9A1) TaxID=443218 RepID=F6ERG9_HOYSD|nr:DUF881 domain-containing protein [Hoyosella subflava]AEF38489.1 Membrane spanning protein DUF881 [Hoyosella subflava DQS3-9A1]